MHLGMNSVKIAATVSDWEGTTTNPIDLPSNDVTSNATEFDLPLSKISVVNSADSYDAAWNNGLQAYYAKLDADNPIGGPGYGPIYDKTTIEWDDDDPRHHSWDSYVYLCANSSTIVAGHPGFKPARIVFNLAMSPALKGTVTVYYDGVEKFQITRDNTTDGKPYIIADITEFLGVSDEVDNFQLPTSFDKSKIRAVVHRTE